MSRMSIATIKNPEFINLKPLEISPLMSACEIKVLYVGQNRNHSFITKEIATEMSKTLRGAPIVGWFRENKDDFGDHGENVTINGDGIRFDCLTKPYGFVSPDAKVWFQEFEDTDEFGNKVTREYLMTTGYLWTGQFEEVKDVIDNGRPHSMELDGDSLDGHWANDLKTGMDFFIINDAIFSKLCILGEDVEPCFEGSNITAPDISKSFSMVDDGFKKTLYKMMQDLKFALEGGQSMDKQGQEFAAGTKENPAVENLNVETSFKKEEEEENKNSKPSEDKEGEKEDNKDKKKEEDYSSNNDNEKKEEEDKTKHSLLEEKYSDLELKYNKLQKDFAALVEFKNQVEDEKKDALIQQFYMLSDEDKADVIKNKSIYSLDEIEAKLSVICVRKKVNFDLDNTDKNDNSVEKQENPQITFNLSGSEGNIPAWISAVKKHKENEN